MRNPFRKLTVLIALLLMTIAVGSSAAQDDESTVVPIQFVTHIQFGSAEQDVYLDNGDGMVRRVSPAEEMAALYEPLYATATFTEHDPFAISENPFGPFEQGAELGFTLVEWMSANGSGTYSVDGDRATIDVSFTDLIPNGVYTMWCSQVITSDTGIEIIDEPCGAEDGSEADILVDDEGNGTYTVELPLLPHTTDTNTTMLAIAYHSDDLTYGAYPGDFGLNSHVQLIAPVGY